ncbi:LexA family protein [Megasphaera stantonii]|uniref:LexA family protein n=1 Tax=Megasphaera stantonii TaxID=2144175 RepID=UPI001DA452B1|nr:XRE family transcriptional regulator [Megasphaera stantonii]HJE82949.1 helix-turn-helix domain-containing protein [Megasphaera stantonii]
MNGKRLKALRENAGFTQKELADLVSLTPKAISFYELGEREPTGEVLISLSKIFNVTTDYLLGNDTSTSKYVKIPVLGKVIAGFPTDAIEEAIDWEEIPREMAATGEYFGLKVKGHSMEPRILEGDVVIVKRQPDVESGKIAVVLINGNEATLKRVKKQKEGITLIATNISIYEPHFYTNEEIEKLPVQILGEVVELRGKF